MPTDNNNMLYMAMIKVIEGDQIWSPQIFGKGNDTTDLLLGGQGLGTHSVLGLAFSSATRSLNLVLSEDTVLNACKDKKNHECNISVPIHIYHKAFTTKTQKKKNHFKD